jgi:hypothetical protein
MKYVLLLLLVWIAPAVLVLLAAAWFVWIRGGKLRRRAEGPVKPQGLPSSEES